MNASGTEGKKKDRNERPMDKTPSPVVRNWRMTPRETLHQARRYSAFVRIMKRALPLAVLGLGIAVLVYVLQPREVGRIAMTFETVSTIENDLTMLRPRLTGTDDDGMPFIVTAASAVEEDLTERVRLEDVQAELTLRDGTLLLLSAVRGVVDRRTSRLEISGGIEMTVPGGYVAHTANANADLRTGIVLGNSPVTAESKFGRLTAERFSFDKDTQQLLFLGDVHMLINGTAQ